MYKEARSRLPQWATAAARDIGISVYRSSFIHSSQLLLSRSIGPKCLDIYTFLQKIAIRISVLFLRGFNVGNVFHFSNTVRPILCKIHKASFPSGCSPQSPAYSHLTTASWPPWRLCLRAPPPPPRTQPSSSCTESSQEPFGWCMDGWELWCSEINPSLVFEMIELVSSRVLLPSSR